MYMNLRNYLHVPIGNDQPNEVNVIVEIPEQSRSKFEYDTTLDIFRLDRALHSAIHYPGDYGFIPETLAVDGDPLDVLVLVIEPTFTGCLVVARPIALVEMLDNGIEDDKILAVPVGEPAFEAVHSGEDMFPHMLRKVRHFFATYKQLEGKNTEIGEWRDAAYARTIIAEAHDRFLNS